MIDSVWIRESALIGFMLFAGGGGWRAWSKLDRRRCAVSAIESGLSCRAAAVQFGVSASSAIRWRTFKGWADDVAPGHQAGDRTSHRIEAHAERVLSLSAEKPETFLAYVEQALVPELWPGDVWRIPTFGFAQPTHDARVPT
jgi:transposase-like protein